MIENDSFQEGGPIYLLHYYCDLDQDWEVVAAFDDKEYALTVASNKRRIDQARQVEQKRAYISDNYKVSEILLYQMVKS